jgi:homoserine dehydrogenase
VGKEFIRLLSEESSSIAARTGFLPVLRAVKSRRGILTSDDGLALDQVLDWLDASALEDAGGPSWAGLDSGRGTAARTSSFLPADYQLILDMVKSDAHGIVVEATPTDLETGEPGLSHITAAIMKGYSVVSLAKGPLVAAFGPLSALAREHGVSLRYSGAVVASPPILDTAAYAMAGAEIYEIEGVLNATTNYVLNSMAQGKAYKSALAEAQALGVAEANAKLDVEGFDSATKLVIIANTVWGMELGLGDVDRHGITALNSRSVRESAAAGLHVRLVARAKMDGLKPLLTVRPEEVPGDHPFANLPGTSKAVRFRSRNMGDVSISGSAADVTAAAASALKDLIHILEERRPR